jgi:hypothetical protein
MMLGDGDGDWTGTSGDEPDPADSCGEEELLVLEESSSTAAFSRGTVNMFDGCASFSILVF